MKTLLLAVILGISLADFVDARPRSTETLRLGINQEKVIPKSKLRVKFVSLIADSRCPIDTKCVWAGNADQRPHIQNGNTRRSIQYHVRICGNRRGLRIHAHQTHSRPRSMSASTGMVQEPWRWKNSRRIQMLRSGGVRRRSCPRFATDGLR